MANLNAPSGLAAVAYRNGNPWNGQARQYCILAADTNAFYIGDVVKSVANADANGIPAMTQFTAGSAARGVIVGIGSTQIMGGINQGGPYINPNDLTKTFRPSGAASANYYALVVDDPDVIFEVMEGSGTAATATSMNKNANLLYAAPAGTSALSGVVVDPTTYATTSTLNVKLLGAVQRLDNVPYTNFQRFLVLLNNHEFASGTAGV